MHSVNHHMYWWFNCVDYYSPLLYYLLPFEVANDRLIWSSGIIFGAFLFNVDHIRDKYTLCCCLICILKLGNPFRESAFSLSRAKKQWRDQKVPTPSNNPKSHPTLARSFFFGHFPPFLIWRMRRSFGEMDSLKLMHFCNIFFRTCWVCLWLFS